MKTTVIRFYLLTMCFINIEAQTTIYFKMFGTDSRDEGYFFKRTCDKGFILAGTTAAIDANNDAYIIKLDSNGNKLWNWNIGFGGVYDGPFSIMETPDSNIIVFISSNAANVQFRMAVFDYNGNQIFEKHDYYLSDGFPEFSLFGGAELLPDGRIVTPVVVNDSILKAYWWNQTGDTLSSVVLDTCRQFPGGNIEKIERIDFSQNADTIYYCYNNYLAEDVYSRIILKTDSDGNVYNLKEFNNVNVYEWFKTAKSEINEYLYYSWAVNDIHFLAFLYGESENDIISWLYYSSPTYDELTSFDVDFISPDTLLVCGDVSCFSDAGEIAHILKLDTSSNMIWHHLYEPYGYNRSALKDVNHYCDCIAAIGYAYNSTASPVADSYDILFVKADLNGVATSITTFEKPDNNLKVFPNPASDILSVNLLPIGESEYTIVDANGREILKGKTQSNQIGVSLLPVGCYQLLWENDGKMYHAGFVKE